MTNSIDSNTKWEARYATPDPYGAGGRWLLEEQRILHSFQAIPRVGRFRSALDLASGEGHFTSLLSTIADRITSIEISRSAIGRAEKRLEGKSVKFMNCDITEVEFPKGSFDLICAIEALFYCKDMKSQVRKWASWLTSDGILIATGPTLPGYFSWDDFLVLFAEQFTVVTPVAVSSRMVLAKLANHQLLPFPHYMYELAMKLTRRSPKSRAKHIAVIAKASDRIAVES